MAEVGVSVAAGQRGSMDEVGEVGVQCIHIQESAQK